MEALGNPHRVLPGHRVGHEQDLVRRHSLLDAPELGHHLVVDLQPAGRVHEHRPGPRLAGRLDRCGDQRRHVALRLGGVGRAEHRHFHPLAQLPQLLLRRRAVRVRGHQERRLLLALQPGGQLGPRGRLARALQAHQQHDRGRHRSELERRPLLAQQHDQLVVHDLDELLARVHRLEGVDPDRLLPHPLHEGPRELVAHVGLEQHPSDLPEPVLDVLLREHTAARQVLEGRSKIFRQRAEHRAR